MKHLTSKQIYELSTGMASTSLESHLRHCRECQSRMLRVKNVDAALRRGLIERASPSFTENILRQIGTRPAPSYTWTVLKHLAPAMALAVVAGIAIGVLEYFHVFQASELQQPATGMQSAYDHLASQMGEGVKAFNHWMAKYFSFAFAANSYGLTAFIVCLFGFIALVDKFIITPMMRKHTS